MTEAARFLDALRRQQEKYQLMLGVAREQKALLEASDVNGLLALVERKRALMGEIEELEKEQSALKEKWTEIRSGLDADTLRRVEEAIEQKRQVLEALVRLEDEAQALMMKQRESTAEELKGLMRKKKARGAYGGPGGSDARFIDDSK